MIELQEREKGSRADTSDSSSSSEREKDSASEKRASQGRRRSYAVAYLISHRPASPECSTDRLRTQKCRKNHNENNKEDKEKERGEKRRKAVLMED